MVLNLRTEDTSYFISKFKAVVKWSNFLNDFISQLLSPKIKVLLELLPIRSLGSEKAIAFAKSKTGDVDANCSSCEKKIFFSGSCRVVGA